MVGRRLGAIFAALMLVTGAAPASASGPPGRLPWYLDQFGGGPTDQKALYDGRLGIVMARAPRPQLYIAWRLLHRQKVGQAAGAALAVPCCDISVQARFDPDRVSGSSEWLATRKLVHGAPKRDYSPTDSEGPYFTWTTNCFDDAFRTAAATLKARIAKYGAASPGVQAWLDGQDAVFANCRRPTALPAWPAGAPTWLRADRNYQIAAAALYQGRPRDAAVQFVAISRDQGSPWRPMAPYLRVRALRRAALDQPTVQSFAEARAAIGELAATPAGTYGRDQVLPMRRSLDYRDRPKALMAELLEELSRPAPPARIAASFRDVTTLAGTGQGQPEMLDWMATLRPEVSDEDAGAVGYKEEVVAGLQRKAETGALGHAVARWRATHDTAWLIAALSLVDPGAPDAAALAAAGEKVASSDPGWLSVQYHQARLGLRSTAPAVLRTRLDAILALRDLSASDRSVFTAQRLQVATEAHDFVRLALRRRLCAGAAYEDGYASRDNGCPRNAWLLGFQPASSVYDGQFDAGTVGLGEDARAVIDRLPLHERIIVGHDPRLPGQLRLDLAMTNYARAVLLQDHAAVDGLAGDLIRLLPQLAPEWRCIRATPVGPAKRFAEFFVLAKVPGIRTDLVDYTRPEGTVAQFQQYWIDWVVLPKGRPVAPAPPPLAAYQQDGVGVEIEDPDTRTDLTCLGECGRGAAPLRLPDFAAAAQGRARIERGYFVRREPRYSDETEKMPPGGVAVWDQMLAYAQDHPMAAQVPEALYWINRASRWGGMHDRSSYRAFRLLHARYPGTIWAKRSPYYYD